MAGIMQQHMVRNCSIYDTASSPWGVAGLLLVPMLQRTSYGLIAYLEHVSSAQVLEISAVTRAAGFCCWNQC